MIDQALTDRIKALLSNRRKEFVDLYLREIDIRSESEVYAPLTDDAIIIDFEIYLEAVQDAADASEPAESPALFINMGGKTLNQESQSYIESIAPTFVCPKCHVRFPIESGALAFEGRWGSPAMYDRPCITEHNLTVLP